MSVGGDGILQRNFILGEKKYVKFKATACDNVPIVITGATYSLTIDGKAEDFGNCIVDGSEFMALIEPQNIGDYVLEVVYTVAPETRKVRVFIHVT